MLNKVILMGRLTADPELRVTTGGVTVCSFTLAVDRPGKDTGTYFLDCVAWEKTAEFLSRNFSKGKLLALIGSLTTRSYTDKNGNTRKATEVRADEVHFCGDYGERREGGYGPPTSPQGGYFPSNEAKGTGNGGNGVDFALIDDEGDLPF